MTPRARIALLVLVLAAGACVSRPRRVQSAPDHGWPAAFSAAQRAVADGRYDAAEQELAAFGRRFEGTPEGDESIFWRALFKMDPANRDARVTEAIPLLDAYLAGPPRPRRPEAEILRRTAETVGALVRAAAEKAAVASATAPRSAADDSARVEELTKLRDELAKTQAELERIKRRLAAPRP